MILRLKGVVFQTEYVDVTKKDPKKWEEFVRRSQGRLKLPVLIHGDREPLEDANTIETYLEETFSEPCMKPSLSGKANEAGIKIYSKFALFMRNSIAGENDRKLRSDLDMELGRLDTFFKKDTSSSPPGLALKPGAFLDGDRLKLPDCNLLPKLMHIKVAGELKDFKIRREHKNVIKYLEEAAKLKAFNEIFNESVKNDIKTGWRNKMGNSSSKG